MPHRIKYTGDAAVAAAIAGGRTITSGEVIDVGEQVTEHESGDLEVATPDGSRLLSRSMWEPVDKTKKVTAAPVTETEV